MRELLVQQKTFAAGLFCFIPASESLQHDSMQNLVSRSFLLSLWWKELTCLGVLVCLALLVTARQGNAKREIRAISWGDGRGPWWAGLAFWQRLVFPAAAVAAVMIVAWLGRDAFQKPTAEQLLAQAYTEHRTLEVRIPGAKFAPMRVGRGVSSGAGSSLDKPAALLQAEALIGEHLKKSPDDPAWLQAKARADLLDGNYESAIQSLHRALESQTTTEKQTAETQPDSPALLSDLASAYFQRAESANRPMDYGNAIETLGKALTKSPDDPVALFNRALACERMFLYTQAVDDWEHYLRVDRSGPWADDARTRLAALREKLKKHAERLAEPLLTPKQIAEAGPNDAAVREKIDARIEDYLNVAVVDWLPKAYPVAAAATDSRGDSRSALKMLAEIAGDKHGDRWLADLMSTSFQTSFSPAVANLAEALKANDTGDNVAARHNAAEAERLFGTQNSAGALRARVEYMFAAHDAEEGDSCIHAARGVEQRMDAVSYPWLRTQFHLEQGTCSWLTGNLGEARRWYEQAAQSARASGYSAIYLRTQDHLSGLNTESGKVDESSAIIAPALARFWSGHDPAMRGYNLYYDVYEASRLTKRPHLQMAAWRDGLVLSDSFRDSVLRAMAHSAMADAAVAADVPSVAEKEFAKAAELFAVAPQIRSTRIARVEAETRLAEVEASSGRAEEAVSRLQGFVPEAGQLSDAFLEILFYTTLGDAESRLGDRKQAESAMHSAIVLAEQQQHSLPDDKSRMQWQEHTSTAYRVLTQIRMREGNERGALEAWEWHLGAAQRAGNSVNSAFPATAQSLTEPNEVGTQLPLLRNETVVSYAILPQGLATWVYDDRGIFSRWSEGNTSDLEARAQHLRSLCSDPRSDISTIRLEARALYNALVAPIEQRLSQGRVLIVELDKPLAGIPFDTLIDRHGRYLGERGPIVSSMGIYYRRNARASVPVSTDSTALVVAVPASSAASGPPMTFLTNVTSEAETVAHNFSSVQLLSAREATARAVVSRLPYVTVFHFAGHALSSQRRSGLLVSDSLLSAESLQRTSFGKMQLAVLSGCDTEGGSASGAYDYESLVRVFLRAGVPNVVASRWDVDSLATQQFMSLFYRALLHGNTAAESIRQAQSDLRSRPGMNHPYYWSAFHAFGTN